MTTVTLSLAELAAVVAVAVALAVTNGSEIEDVARLAVARKLGVRASTNSDPDGDRGDGGNDARS